MAVYILNEDGIATIIRSALTQGELEVLVQAGQIEDGASISSCIKETLAVATGKKPKQLDGEV